MSAKFDPTKPVRTRNGLPARIICRDRKGLLPIVAMYESHGVEETFYCQEDGSSTDANTPQPLDLVNVPEKSRLVVWINVYGSMGYTVHNSKDSADNAALTISVARTGCVKVDQEYEVGQGL